MANASGFDSLVAMVYDFSGPRRLGYVLLTHYAIFMVVSVLGETGILYDLDSTHHSLRASSDGTEAA